MSGRKFTDEEIVKALKSCQKSACLVCPYNVVYAVCRDVMCGDALDLINRQKAEIERLREKRVEDEKLLNDRVVELVNAVSQAHLKYENALEEQIKTVKAEAIKEFLELLECVEEVVTSLNNGEAITVVDTFHIQRLAKKMMEEKE